MNICVIGVGNIGMRYVQGISNSFPDAQLFLVDAPSRLHELEKMDLGGANLLTSLEDITEPLDLCVVSTSCQPRLDIYKRCLELQPRYIILEKYLFKSRQEFEECLSLPRVPTFVNQWMYGSRTFDCLFTEPVSTVELTGSGWGLACNAVHWIDVFKRHMNITDLQVGSDTNISKVFPSKRAGYEEIYGELVFVDEESDKTFSLIDRGDDILTGAQEIRVDGKVYLFDYAHIKREERIIAHFPYFSGLIGNLVEDIMDKGSCNLPLLEESISQHLLMERIFETLDHRPNIT
ncbi:hypothetical protein EYC98_14715 [Halieaceae bacterium IMCC14734]|uniref:Gfo/Idh/MocA-like oxidoreductase N-terminal domain-containing protein n=1 Tax=Candidatus Litorirhabdus singularis TaxID=2518993 RepID=A0ABT3TK04_9GAMM|nr:hypothetical protein [Candidatus Litorirhabdus singularis]MCX2982111.1 hypothetical protein [Candidatus Litorirhabdus singularis]